MYALASDGRCEDLRHPDLVNLIISIIILIGMLVSYLPQHVRIIRRRTSEGISAYFILLGTTSATSAFANIILLDQSRQDVACCKELEAFQCMAGLLGIAQIGAQWICVGFLFLLFVFFRFDTAAVPEEELGGEPPKFEKVLFVSSLILVHVLAVLIITALVGLLAKESMSIWANLLGVTAALLAAVQYVPQILTTYRLKHVGSLSIPMMLIQTPGGFLFAASLFARFRWAGWSNWGIFLLAASMQGTLLVMAIYYELQAHRLDVSPSSTLYYGNGLRQTQTPNYLHDDGFDDDRHTIYSSHPHHYADNAEDLTRILDRQDSEAARKTTPLLKPGGIGMPRRPENLDQNRC